METTTYSRIKVAAAVLMVALSAQAQAALLTFNLGWSGESFSNTAVATAVLVIDDTVLPNPGSTGDNGQAVLLADLGIVSFDMVVTGATIGDGTYSIDTFAAAAWNSGALGLDLSTELVGQATDGNPWGTSDGFSGDFNVFSLDGFSPSGTFFYQLTTAGGLGDNMLLTNFTPVPIGPALPLLLSAVGALGLLRRQRRN